MPNFLLFIIVPSPEQIKVDGFEYACGPDVRGYGIGLAARFYEGRVRTLCANGAIRPVSGRISV